MIIRDHNSNFLESINGNLGTALGFKKPTGQGLTKIPAIIVFVPLKINPKWIPESQLIPKSLNGPDDLWCPLDVVEGSKVEVEIEEPIPESPSEIAERLRGWENQVWAGSQVSYWENQRRNLYSVGTISAFVRAQYRFTWSFNQPACRKQSRSKVVSPCTVGNSHRNYKESC